MKAAILTGGKGTRMSHITQGIPKTLLPVGGTPLLIHHINWLKQEGVNEIYLLLGHLANKIEDYFNDKTYIDVHIHFVKEEVPLGTAGGLKSLRSYIQEDFLFVYGDVMMDLDLKRLAQFHESKKSLATLVVHPNDHHHDSNLIKVDAERKITAFLPKERDTSCYYENIVNAGLYMLDPAVFNYIPSEPCDFVKDVFPAALLQGEKLYAYKTSEYLKDAGTPERLEQVREDYKKGIVAQKNRRFLQRAIFLDRDGVLNAPWGFISSYQRLTLLPRVAEAIRKINRSEYLSIVVTNQSVIARNLCDIEELQRIHQKLETLLGQEEAYVDAIYFCPHHPDKGYPEERQEYKIQCDCRKPATGMIMQAQEEFNIDLRRSFIIGDQTSDIQLGKNCGLRSILIKTEENFKASKSNPDYYFNSLIEAVDFILSLNTHRIFNG